MNNEHDSECTAPPTRDEYVRAIVLLHNAGMSIERISRELGRSERWVRAALKEGLTK